MDQPSLIFAHGIGTRGDLPVDLSIVVGAAAVVLVLSFVGLSTLWHRSRFTGDEAGRPVPGGVQTVLDNRVLRGILQAAALVVSAFVLSVALLGSNEQNFNLSPYAFYITFWVGLVPASILLGPVWRAVNPLRTIYRGLAKISGPAPGADGVERLGMYPAAGFMVAFAFLELVYPDRAEPRVVGGALLVFATTQLGAALWYGEEWFERGDPFEAWSTLLGRFSVLGRRSDDRFVLRNPLNGSDGTPATPGLAAFICAVLASTAYDGLTRAQWFIDNINPDNTATLKPTLILLATTAVIYGVFVLSCAASRVIEERVDRTGEGESRWRAADVFAHSVVPIAAGYAVAHYFSLLLFDGQLTWILASNPYYLEGVDYFGVFNNEVDRTFISGDAIAYVQVAGVVTGHVLGVVMAHDRAVRLARSRRAATLSQLPLLGVMVLFTGIGLSLLLG